MRAFKVVEGSVAVGSRGLGATRVVLLHVTLEARAVQGRVVLPTARRVTVTLTPDRARAVAACLTSYADAGRGAS